MEHLHHHDHPYLHNLHHHHHHHPHHHLITTTLPGESLVIGGILVGPNEYRFPLPQGPWPENYYEVFRFAHFSLSNCDNSHSIVMDDDWWPIAIDQHQLRFCTFQRQWRFQSHLLIPPPSILSKKYISHGDYFDQCMSPFTIFSKYFHQAPLILRQCLAMWAEVAMEHSSCLVPDDVHVLS